MTNDITAGSFVRVNQTNQASDNKQNQATVLPSDSFKVVAKIANSNRLSETEKSGLISNVALIDKYAKGSLRTKLLNSVTATTLYLEKSASPKPATTSNVNAAVQQFKQVQQAAPAPSQNVESLQRQVENVERRVENLPKQTRNVELTQVNQQIPTQDVEAVFAQPVENVAQGSNVNVRQVPTLAEARQSAAANSPSPASFEVQDNVVLSSNAQITQELYLPGGGESVDIPLPGSGGRNVDIPVLGSGEFEEIPLPGQSGGGADIQAEVAARVARLDALDIPELPLPGGVNVSEVAAQIEASPEQAIESIGELVLPGGGSEAANGSVNEQAARVALSV
jgi:hypothetical protein